VAFKNSSLEEQAYVAYGEFAQNQAKCTNTSSGDLFNLRCFEFASWSELIVAINETNADLTDVGELNIKPSEVILLTGELDFQRVSEIMCYKAPNNYDACHNFMEVYIAGLKGVDVACGWTHPGFMLTLLSSTLAFYYSGSSPGHYQCNEKTILETLAKNGSFFKFNNLVFKSTVKYDQENPVCPFLFANAQLNELDLYGLVDSFLVSNLFKSQLVNSSSSTVNSSISDLEMHGYNYALDESLLNRLIFEQVQNLHMFGSIGSIQSDLFKSSFNQIIKVDIYVDNLTNFFHQVGLAWTIHLSNINTNIWIMINETENAYSSWLNPGFGYTYPNSDLCIFARFSFLQPQQKHADGSFALVTPVLLALNFSDNGCTDSLAWLTHGFNEYNVFSVFAGATPIAYLLCWNESSYTPNLTTIKTKIDKCNSLLNVSIESSTQADSKIYMDYNDVVFIFQFAFDFLSFLLIPLACILGLLLNARVVWTVLKKGKKELNEAFYEYMTLNSIFNCLFCLIYAFYPINYCLRYETGFFCSTIYNSVAAQVIKIIFIGYFGEVIKMCSNISYIFITINRYMLVSKEHNSILAIISEWNMKRVMAITVLFSLLINIGHCFQYRINYGWALLLNTFGVSKLTYDLYPSIVIFNTSFQVYSIVYFVINFAIFFLINTCIESSLVIKMRKEIAEKRKRMEEEIRMSSANNSSDSEVINKLINLKQKKIVNDANKETWAIKMVVTNSLVNFFFRLPEIFVFFSSNSSFLNFLIRKETVFFFDYTILTSNISGTMVSISNFCYILTFTTNVIINCVFNEKFKLHFTWSSNRILRVES
jgi:hypothetical protein